MKRVDTPTSQTVTSERRGEDTLVLHKDSLCIYLPSCLSIKIFSLIKVECKTGVLEY